MIIFILFYYKMTINQSYPYSLHKQTGSIDQKNPLDKHTKEIFDHLEEVESSRHISWKIHEICVKLSNLEENYTLSQIRETIGGTNFSDMFDRLNNKDQLIVSILEVLKNNDNITTKDIRKYIGHISMLESIRSAEKKFEKEVIFEKNI